MPDKTFHRLPSVRSEPPAALFAALPQRAGRCALDPGSFRHLGWGAPVGGGAPLGLVAAEPEAIFAGGLEALQQARAWLDARPDRAPFSAVLIGALSYSLGRAFAPRALPLGSPDEPDVWLAGYRAVYAYAPERGQGAVVGGDRHAVERLAALIEAAKLEERALSPLAEPIARTPDSLYRDQVAAVQRYIRAGDAYQVNLSRRLDWTGTSRADAGALFRTLQERAPAPFAAALDLPRHTLVSNSPERFLRVTGEQIETCPIKGTRPRSSNEFRDRALALDLERSSKDRAEHLMIVDLERNDLGRICRTGSVRVRGLASRLTLPTVHHLVSSVSGVLRERLDWHELLAATFPGGSITGAPKLRAMEIIAELEPVQRGVYTGAIGYFDARGGLDLSIAIRTAVLRDGGLSLHVGGGIVADSDPAAELAETSHKARAFTALCAGEPR